MKKIISCLLVLAMLATMIPVMAVSSFAEPTIAEDATTVTVDGVEYAVIRNAEDLSAQIDENRKINNNLYLMGDVDLQGATFTKVMAELNDIILEGNGYAIYNFKLDGTGKQDLSLFAVYNGEGTTIRNLNIGKPNAYIEVNANPTETGGASGVLLSYTNSTTLMENVNVYGNVKATNTTNIGLFIGRGNGKHIFRNCNAYGTVEGAKANTAGGFVGCVGDYDVTAFTFENCNNYARVSGAGKVSGFVGQSQGKFEMNFIDCGNYGNLVSTGTGAGGFIGEFWAPKNPAIDYNFVNCVNYGNINGSQKTGGIIGYFNTNTNGQGNNLKLTGCKNYGTITGTGGDSGGIIGTIGAKDNITAINCANFGVLTGTGNNKAGFCGSISMNTNYTLKISYFLNMGSVTSGSRASGVTGWFGAGIYELDHCVNLGSLNGKGNSGGISSEASGTVTINNCISAATVASTSGSLGCIIGNAGSATGENNRYMTSSGANTTLGTTELKTWEEVLTALNAEYASIFGTFMLNDASNGVVLAAPKLAGVQESKANEQNEYSIRLVAALNSARYAEIGFKITLGDSTVVNKIASKTIFTKLLANDEGTMISYTANDLGGAYIYALNVDGLSTAETYVLHVTPYAIALDGETVYDGATYTVTYQNGAYVGAAVETAN